MAFVQKMAFVQNLTVRSDVTISQLPRTIAMFIAFSSEVGTGSREEKVSKQQSGASLLIQSEAKML
jgi:hypothetical protein